jgi:hypothetical protein
MLPHSKLLVSSFIPPIALVWVLAGHHLSPPGTARRDSMLMLAATTASLLAAAGIQMRSSCFARACSDEI